MVQTPVDAQLLYPDSDGKPMAENTLQYRWIVRLVTNLKHLYRDQTVFVAGDLLWYPEQVTALPAPAHAPDVMVVFGRPDRDRGSYKQWEEDNIAPQVVFEIISPSNTAREMLNKQLFYRQYGVLELFFYDPESYNFWGLVRPNLDQDYTPITALNFPWASPQLGIRFELFDDGLAIFAPNGDRFQDPADLFVERDQAQQERDRAFAKLRELGIDPNEL